MPTFGAVDHEVTHTMEVKMPHRLTRGRLAVGGSLLATLAASLVSVPLVLSHAAVSNPEIATLVAPLSYLGGALISCIAGAIAVVWWTYLPSSSDERRRRRVSGARVIALLAVAFAAANVTIVSVAASAGITPGTLIIFFGAAAVAVIGAGLLWAYRANSLRSWAV